MANQTDKATIDLVINGRQSETSLKDIATAAVNARKALSSMAQTDPGYARQKQELEALMRAQQQRIVRIHEEKTAWEKFKAGTGSITAGITGANLLSAGIGAIKDGLRAAVTEYKEFNAASADMAANLGVGSKAVDYFNAKAKEMGPAMGKSAAEMLEGFKLVGSANSDLVKTPELLVAVTKQAVVLSQASKMSLADATASLVGSMNQFDAGADQSTRFINVMAGGAQVGSAEIADMAMSLKASGIVAHMAGLSFEETNGALQSLSKESLKGEQAGTMFRNILLELQKGTDATNPSVVGLDKALDNLAKQNLSAAQVTKLFGKENVTAALSLINHRDRVAEFTKGLTGTSSAYDMASKNNETYEHKLATFDAVLSKVALTIGTRVIPMLTGLLEGATKVADWFDEKLTPAAEAATKAYSDQKAKVQDLTKNLSPLLDRHDELKRKTILTKNEQAELKTIVGQVASIVPSAITEFDKYGHALGVNTEKAREYIKVQRQLLKVKNEESIQMHQNKLDEEEKQAADYKKYRDKSTSHAWDVVEATEEELKVLDAQNAKLLESIAGRKALLKELKGENLELPTLPVTPTEPIKPKDGTNGGGKGKGGGLTDDEKKAITDKKKANSDAILAIQEYKAKATQDDKTRELAQAQFEADKEKEKVKTSKANAELKRTWVKAIDDKLLVDRKEIEEKYTLKQKEEQEKQMESLRKTAEAELELKKKQRLAEILMEVANGDLTKEEGEKAKLNAEESFLGAKLLLNEAHYQSLLDLYQNFADKTGKIKQDKKTEEAHIEGEITENQGNQATARGAIVEAGTKTEQEAAESKKKAEKDLFNAKKQIFDDSVSVLKGFFKENTIVYKAAYVAQQAWALSEVAVNYSRAVMGAIASAAGVPFPGNLLAIAKGIALPTLSAASAVANIRAQKYDAPAFAEGGFTNSDAQPGGFTSGATFYKKGNYIAGEAGREWIMSAPMLKNPVYANLAGALQAIQQTGSYGSPANAMAMMGLIPRGSAQSGHIDNQVMGQILQRLESTQQQLQVTHQQQVNDAEQNRQTILELSKRPINYNYFKVRETNERIDYINTSVNL